MIDEEQFVLLVTRKLTGVATLEEITTLEEMISRHPELKERYLHLEHYFRETQQPAAADTEQALERTWAKIQAANTAAPAVVRPIRWRKYAAVAAACALLGAAIFFFNREKEQAESKPLHWVKQKNGNARKAYIELADGSVIWLNAASQVTYPQKFDSKSRTVYLEGEAFFEIAPSARPFIVHLKKGTVKVLGTSFNIKAYDNEPVQTSVITGKVAFIPRYEEAKKVSDTIVITPDIKVTYTASTGTIVKSTMIDKEDKAWTEDRLIFRNATLEEIGAGLERKFDKKVLFEADAPKQFRLTGSFHNNSLEDIMYYLSKSKAFHYRITDSTLVIGE
ncbi:FecR family protein [Chitinophaga terrae (ex Kim and Jung 2007)]|uniref:FecR family protein n=1 Tax=Chitinophaga terrae (ex Kim and Jung 2007) TaxID=408074 RepID=A0A1H4FNE6_9BACT|nr:FecR domain-containing protein [Chitinophaga terrae (ex Kim and Jung 2007)]GEP89048.1 anti-sigma factor [Chitinophaga terrae (ex Kim and Jung 2007)]SEA98218.1 FecR family protein [Chitinophaga terrae (ex Kim and Jung 2007)]